MEYTLTIPDSFKDEAELAFAPDGVQKSLAVFIHETWLAYKRLQIEAEAESEVRRDLAQADAAMIVALKLDVQSEPEPRTPPLVVDDPEPVGPQP